MSGNNYLVDTNIILYIINGNKKLSEFLYEQEACISVITEMELLSYSKVSKQELERMKRFIEEFEILQFDNEIKKQAIDVRIRHKLKLPDSIIAATAIAHNIPFITADKQFKLVANLPIILYEPDKHTI